MIISASRRTDIPAFFSDWLIRRLKEQYTYVRNPMNFHQVSNISLSPDVVDCIVFWTKNPGPMIGKLHLLEPYLYYVQFTLNGYGADLEANLPPLASRIDTFRTLSECIGRDRVLWRYDPIIVNHRYSIDWHINMFRSLTEQLCPYTEKVTISFIDLYAKIAPNIKGKQISELSYMQKNALAKAFAEIAHSCGLKIDTCAEDIDLSAYGIQHARCIDDRLISRLLRCPIDAAKDKNQRLECGCMASIDLGLYNTCQNGCVYCYANHHSADRRQNLQAYDPHAPLLCSTITELDRITERKVKSLKEMQKRMVW